MWVIKIKEGPFAGWYVTEYGGCYGYTTDRKRAERFMWIKQADKVIEEIGGGEDCVIEFRWKLF